MLSRHITSDVTARMLCRLPVVVNILTMGGQVSLRNLTALAATAATGAATQLVLSRRARNARPGRHRRTRA